MGNVMEYECPKCGGTLEFHSSIQKLKCSFCDAEYEMEEMQVPNEAGQQGQNMQTNMQADSFQWNTDAGSQWQKGEQDGIRVYSCQSCGGEIVGDATMASTKCPFCDNPIVMTGQISGDLKPDYVLPFKLDKKDAKSAFEKHLLDKKLLPKEFRDKNKIDEIKGIYVPFWLFDTELDTAIVYNAENVKKWRSGDYVYTKTDYFDVLREGSIAFENIPVDGSSKMPDDLMESLEPFDFKEAVPFNPGYLAGYAADRYDVDAQSSIGNINTRVRQSAENAFKKTVSGYSYVAVKQSFVQLKNNTVKYALYPVWFLNVTWNGEKYTFAMNGQTGKFVGNLPIDKKAKRSMFMKWTGIFAVIGAIATAIAMIL